MKKHCFALIMLLLVVNATNKIFAQKSNKSESPKKQTAQPASPAPVNKGDVKPIEGNKKVEPESGEAGKSGSYQANPKGNANTAVLTTPASLEALFNNLAKNSLPVIEEKPQGQINWTEQYIEARGQAVIDNEKFKNPAQAKLMATRGAVVVAQRNLLEIVKGVQVIGESTVQDMITMNDYVYTRVEGVVKGAHQVGNAREMNGYMEVTMRMPIYGQKGVAGAFGEAELAALKQKIGIKEMSARTDQAGNSVSGDNVIDGSRPFVFNFRGKQIDPSMFPVIIDEAGNVQLDFSKWYDPTTGKFPKYLQLSKEILQDAGFQKGVDIIDLVQNSKGQFTLPQDSKKKVVWQKIGNVAQKVGKVLFSVL
jgi:hypothetical protein